MHEGHGFQWISHLPVLGHWPNHVAMSIILVALVLAASLVARVQLKSAMGTADGAIIPEPKLTYRNFFEIIAESLYKLTESVIGHHEAPTYFPVIGSLFVFIFVSNLVGLIPGFLPPTDNFNTTLAVGAFVFLYYNYAGIRANGFVNHMKHFLGPVWWLAWLILPIELVSHLFRPLSLALRLRGNIMGDHVVLGVFNNLVGPYFIPVIFYGLGFFVAFVQAFVFCLMTMVYISLSIAHEEH
jgi:F-type H+-transporting ATPase subunit a